MRFREGFSEQEKNAVAAGRGARRAKKLRGASRLEKLELESGQDPLAFAADLRTLPGVELAEPNYLISHAQLNPDDARFGEQWALKNAGQSGGNTGSDISAAPAWNITTGASTAVIAVLDSGIDFTHADLRNNQWTNSREKKNRRDDDRNGFTDDLHGWDWVADSGVIRDEQGHGTAIAGIIAAEGNNGTGVSGVLWQARLMSLRVLDNTGTGDVARAVEAIDYAITHEAQVINCSWGTEAESVILRDAIERAGQHGIVVVTSAGNNGRDIETEPYYPSSFDLPNLISVASTDQFDNLAQFSNWGGARVTLAAPGTDILTTKMGGDYWTVSGTSASAPLVAGIAGLVKTQRPWLNAAGVRQAVLDGARRVDTLAGKVSTGGVANASGALERLAGPYDPPAGNGDGNSNGNGNGNGQDRQTTPPPASGHGGKGEDDFKSKNPVDPTQGAAANLPNLDEIGSAESHEPGSAPAPIRSNLAPICDSCYEGGGVEPNDPEFSTSRSQPENETGQPGVDLGSRNFNWSTGLVSLPGRSGHDLNLSIFYNSLVWTKQGSSVQYNPDNGSPGPGFHLAFPTVQKRFYDAQTGAYAFMLVTPSGGRTKLRQVGASTVYDAVDSTYTQFDSATNVLRTTDGTQYLFINISNGEKRCYQIKDRNGNYISIAYDGANRIDYVTDTLGRVVDFVYDTEGNLTSLTQARAGMTSTLVTFGYGSLYMQPSFPGLSIFGPNNQHVSVLTQVGFADGSRFNFEYNPFGQIHTIRRYAPDNHQLSYTGYNLPGSYWAGMSAQSDCPRFTERRDWVEYGVMNASAEVLTTYAAASDGSWSQVMTPDRMVHKEYFATSGWQKGLVTQTETFHADAPTVIRKRVTAAWTQDDTNLAYQKNPRVFETNIYDEAGNRRRTTIDYGPYAAYGLPNVVAEYAADATTVLRRTYTDYRTDAVYINRRIFGLTSARHVYDGNWALMVKETYSYDWDWNGDMFQDVPGGVQVVQHDRANFGPTFISGRGNLSQMSRYDVNDPNNANNTWQETKWRHNVAGSLLMERDHHWHQKLFEYGDRFSDDTNRNTFAYQTKLTDANGFSSYTDYKYETGAVTRAQDPKGAIESTQHDTVGRISRVSVMLNNAEYSYRRWSYPASMGYLQVFSSVTAGAGEVRSEEHFDGVGRTRATSVLFPGSAGGYRAVHMMWDSMGRAAQRSNPTEINAGWVPSGDDAAGWVWTTHEYDWQGRPTITRKPDNWTTELSYSSCGCAGGGVETSRDERGRRRKSYKDVLGRLVKVEDLNWDGSVYSTANYTYNVRDQLTQINHANQIRTLEYDGRGRLWRRTTPEQGATTYNYDSDDTVNSVTDARGASVTYGYNYRHQVTSMTYGAPAGVAATPNVTFGYDESGNRTSMNDGLGSVAYHYDTLSRMDWEERTFSGVGTYRTSYAYNLAGQLTNVTNPWGSQVGYTRDAAGQVSAVTGAGASSYGTYAGSISYRAFGGVKQMAYGNSRTLSVGYDNRMRVKTWNIPGTMGWEYNYDYFGEHSSRVTYARNLSDGTLDRSYDYDHVGRLTIAYSGMDARAHVGVPGSSWGVQDGPYASPNFYDVYGNIVGRQGWGGANAWFSANYTNNRRDGFSHDAAGNVTNDMGQNFTYDATGQQASASHSGYSLTQRYDGDTLRVGKVENSQTTYYLRSTVLGGQVTAEVVNGGWNRGYVYDGRGGLLALQQNGTVRWVHQDPVTKSQRLTDPIGGLTAIVDLDPWGGETGRSWNSAQQSRKYTTYERDGNGSDEAMMRRYNRWHARFDQPDPYDGSYDLNDPQSFNRYAYVQNDPVNFTDPTGLFCVTRETWDERTSTLYIQQDCYLEDGGGGGIFGGGRGGGGGGGGGGDFGGGGGGGGGGGTGGTGPGTQQPSPEQQKCDDKLAGTFGDKGSVAAGSGFEPKNMPSVGGSFRGGAGGHLNNAMHLYGSNDGYSEGGVYIPAGGKYIGKNPNSSEDSYMFYYSRLGNATGVTLFTSHVANFKAPQGTTSGRTRIGDIGGDGGRSITKVGTQNPHDPSRGTYIHAHLAIHKGHGFTGNRRSFFDVFCK